ncbi:TPA: VENN motif pre-toxin domain-containing protein [Escherichia coli]|nr:VENN motif pre-toxin domain-containing protein [Escherichia coli]
MVDFDKVLISEDIARTQGELNALKAAKEATGETLPANATEKQRQEYLAKLRDTQAYRNEMAKYGTGSEIQRGIQAATAALQGLAGGNLAGALAGASAPELAHLLKSTEKDPAVKAIAHAILGGAVAAMQSNNVAAGAAGAATGELAARAIGMLYPGVKLSDLSEEQKQTISTLATVSAGLAGGLIGNSTASAAVGAQSGKNAVENNALSELVPPRVQQDASLAFDLSGKGVTNDEIIKAVDKSHIGPSVGDTAKIHGDVKGQVAGGYVAGGYLEGVLSEDKFSINGGVTKVLGWRADVSAGLTFGPYPIKDFNPAYDYSGAISTGIFSVEGSIGKDGFGGSFRVGGGIGASIRQSENSNNQPEINGSGSTELISWSIKKD